MNERVKILFEDMSYGTTYRFLETGKDDNELITVGKKRGLVLPSPDIAIFKGQYAMVDKENLNKCTLSEDQVKQSLATLVGKAIDVDHYRGTVRGWWVDSYLENGWIYSYGAFWKSNFEEDYNDIKKKMEKGEIKLSFEAYGEKQYTSDKSYNLVDIHFAGGAILDVTNPAFPEAKILEFAKVLEIGAPKDNVSKNIKSEELAQFHTYDMDTVSRLISEVDCLECQEKGYSDILSIDFVNSNAKIKCLNCNAEMDVNLSPMAKLTKKARQIKSIKTIAKTSTSVDIKSDKNSMVSNLCFRTATPDEIISIFETSSLDDMILEVAYMNEIEYVNFEEARYNDYDMDVIRRIMYEAEKPKGEQDSYPVIESVDFKNQKVVVRYEPTNTIVEIDLSVKPKTTTITSNIENAKKLTTEERNKLPDDMFAVVKVVENKTTKKPRKIRMYPIYDEPHVRNALSRIAQEGPKQTLEKMGIDIDTVKKKILKRAKELNMKTLLEKYNKASVEELVQTFAKEVVGRELTSEELIKAYNIVEYKKSPGTSNDTSVQNTKGKSTGTPTSLVSADVDEAKLKEAIKEVSKGEETNMKTNDNTEDIKVKEAELAKVKSELEKANAKILELQTKLDEIEKAKVQAMIKSRREELGEEFAKDLNDEQIMNDDKFTIAKQNKEIASLKAKDIKTASTDKTKTPVKADLTVGSQDKISETRKSNKTVRDLAFGNEDSEE